jgi:hypothetical protein
VAYAIMSFGGFLGMGESYHPLPWRALTYDPGVGGYVVDIDRNRLEGALITSQATNPIWSDMAYGQSARPKVRWKQTPHLHQAGFVFKGRILLSQKGDLKNDNCVNVNRQQQLCQCESTWNKKLGALSQPAVLILIDSNPTLLNIVGMIPRAPMTERR